MQRFVGFTVAALAGVLALPAAAQNLGPLVEISRPNVVAGCDTGFNTFGTFSLDDATEPAVATNPMHPNNIVAAWIQGPFQDIIAAVSFDGGQSWQQVPIPFTTCSGGPYTGTGDPELAFATNGDLYAAAIVGFNSKTGSPRGVAVSKSGDGGLHWSAITLLPGSFTLDQPADFETIAADPTDARFVYIVWEGSTSGKRGPTLFSRTTDGGLTWEPAREVLQTGTQSAAFGQIIALPGGTLMDIVQLQSQTPNKPPQISLQVIRSTDQGQTWSVPATVIAMMPLFATSSNVMVVDPKTGQLVHDGFSAWVAVDKRNGNLYAVWEDGRFSNFQYNDTALSMSTDGGSTWSAPIRVNQTPINIPVANRQSFFPFVAVAADGTIGVTYYDFRFNSVSPGLATDYWLVQCHPSSTSTASNPACWSNEVRLTNTSFNMEAVSSIIFGEFFLGDYFGMTTSGNVFISIFTQVDDQNVTGIFARRVGP